MPYGVDEWPSRRGEARDEATGDQEGQEVERRLNKGEEPQTSTNIDEHSQYTMTDNGDLPPEPPPAPLHHLPEPSAPPPPPSPSHPKQHHNDDDDDLKSNTTAARTCADAVHDPGGQMVKPEDKPPSVRLKGEKNKATSLNVKVDNVEMDDDHAKVDNNESKPPQDPVGTTDSDKRRPNEPTEPPDKKEGERGVDGESTVESTVERVELKTLSQVDQPGGRGVKRETRSKDVEDKLGGKVEDDECQQGGRMGDTGDATSSTSCDSGRVEARLLPENKEGQQRNDMQKVSKHIPGLPTPHPCDMTRPTHLTNP
ncbi:hypothetical protein BDN67DRAFT_1015370 [Paxillus ammoniavirescens]|nr:hypothetical protein BDN67DRAFT_1015370 [Paxillus ammoniavirescens]